MGILGNAFDELMLSVFTDEELKNLPALELNERKMMFIAGAEMVMRQIEGFKDEKKFKENMTSIRQEIDDFVNNQLEE